MQAIEKIIAAVGRFAGWLAVPLIVLIVVDVLLRWAFDLTAVWVVEVEWHLFALLFLLGAPFALQRDRHVRVDLFYERFSVRDRAQVDFFGGLLLLLPWCVLLLITGGLYAREAWLSGEGSPNPGGLPIFAPVKSAIPLAALLLLLQGGVLTLRAYYRWRGEAENAEEL